MHKMNDQLTIRMNLFFHAALLKNSIINAHLQDCVPPFPQLYKLLESLTKGFFCLGVGLGTLLADCHFPSSGNTACRKPQCTAQLFC